MSRTELTLDGIISTNSFRTGFTLEQIREADQRLTLDTLVQVVVTEGVTTDVTNVHHVATVEPITTVAVTTV
jgi:hypothetical protein